MIIRTRKKNKLVTYRSVKYVQRAFHDRCLFPPLLAKCDYFFFAKYQFTSEKGNNSTVWYAAMTLMEDAVS